MYKASFDEALNHFDGNLDILVNNSGMIRRHKSEEFPLEDWDMVINLNLNTGVSALPISRKSDAKARQWKNNKYCFNA